jgi:hypothetical protein
MMDSFAPSEQKFAAEKQSIDDGDLFGISVEDGGTASDETENPFALFLADLANGTGGTAEFDGYAWEDWPNYRVCIEEANKLAGGDSELAEDIHKGRVLLNEMPKEIRPARLYWGTKEQADWVRAKRDEFRQEFVSRCAGQSKAEEPSV